MSDATTTDTGVETTIDTTVADIDTPTATERVTTTATATETTAASGGDLEISRIDPVEEFVVLENAGSESLDLDGYVIDFGGIGQEYAFSSYELDPGESVRVYTGTGDSRNSVLYADFFYPVLDNDGDRVIVEAPDGEVVAGRSYS